MKQAITDTTVNYDTWVLVPRETNLSTLARLGFTFNDVRNNILSLSLADYCEGPIRDYSVKGNCWVFCKNISGLEVYIKLKLATFGPIKKVRVISFHIADDSL